MKPTPSASPHCSEPQPAIRTRQDCRLCGSTMLTRVLSLGQTPLANEFVAARQRGQPQDRFPLEVWLCGGCGHAQLLDVVDPQRLFANYVYVSSTSPVFVDHFRRYAEAMLAMTQLPKNSAVVEIGSNDGALLRFFKEAGMRVLGIDPASAIAAEATRRGIETRAAFFTTQLARQLKGEGWSASIIAANNVFAHADDLHDITDGVARLLERDGLFVFEVSYLLDVVEKTLFDTIYHEHLSYHTVKPLTRFFEVHDMRVIDAHRVDSHGGSLRGIAARRDSRWPVAASVGQLIQQEQDRRLFDPATFAQLGAQIGQVREELVGLLRRLKQEGKRVAGFGAPAKATTLMFHLGIGPDLIEYIVDDSPWKQGLFSPGHHIPVVPSSYVSDAATRPDYIVILAWNFAQPIMAKHQAFHTGGGRFIVPLPRVEVL